MKVKDNPVDIDDLIAYADGQLESAREHLVECYLREHPEIIQQVNVYRQQSIELHQQFDPMLSAPIPRHLLPPEPTSLTALKNISSKFLHSWHWQIAAAMAWVTLGLTLGWVIKGQQTAPVMQAALAPQSPILLRQASIAHAVYAPEIMHPVEVTAKDEAHLVKWLSKRLDKQLRIPSFTAQGFALVGGRLLPAEPGNAAAQFMYENKTGQRLTLYVRAMEKKDPDTSFRYGVNKGIGVFYWIDRDWGYALSGRFERAMLLEIADVAYRQFNT